MRIAMLLSGGVDSSVALRLLKRDGHDVTAFYLKIWLEDELSFLGECPWEEDLHFARGVCAAADVPLEVIALQREYKERVVSWTISELEAGRTPSPDVLCNQRIKFGAFLEALAQRSFDRIASGHYARIRSTESGRVELLKGSDPVKDQTYFLFQLDQGQLAQCLFPIGGYYKSEVRQLAEQFALPNRQRADSQGICFLGKIRYDDFIRSYLGEQPGEIRELGSGRKLGRHRGYWFHTIGQRRGLGLGGGPWYVAAKDVEANVVYVCHGEDLSSHRQHRFRIPNIHWIAAPPDTHELQIKIRHSPHTAGGHLTPLPEGGFDVELDEQDPGIADGQVAVIYDGEHCLGGGMITTEHSRNPTR